MYVYVYMYISVHYFIGEKSVLTNNTMLNLHDKITMIKRQHSIPQIFKMIMYNFKLAIIVIKILYFNFVRHRKLHLCTI